MKTTLQIIALVALGLSAVQAAPVAPTLKGDLIAVDGKKAKRFDDTKLAGTKYFAVYYSASWCGPCKAFTPKLVEWYNKTKPTHPEFELIFVSSDHSEKAMESYMVKDAMPWPALAFDKKKGNKSVVNYGGRGIPCLVLIDADGNVLSHSYEGTTYVGPHKVMEDIDKTLASASGTAATPAAGTTVSGAGGGSQVGTAPVPAKTHTTQGSNFDEVFKKK